MSAGQTTAAGGPVRPEPEPFHPPALARILVGGSAIMSLANSITIPFLTVFLRTRLHLPVATVGFVVGSSILFGIVGGILAGVASDLVGRRRVLLAALALVAVGFAGFLLVQGAVSAFLVNGLTALASSAFTPVAKVLLTDLLPPRLRVSWFSYQYLATNAGYAAGPLIGVALGLTGARPSFLVAAVVYLGYLAVVTTATRRIPPPYPVASGGAAPAGGPAAGAARGVLAGFRDAVRAVLSDRRMLLLMLAAILLETVHRRISALLAQDFVQDFDDSARMLAAVMTANAVAVLVCQLPAAKLVARHDPVNAITVGGVLSFTGMAGFAFSGTMWQFVAAMVVFTVGETLIVPAEFAFLDRLAPPELRGSYFGVQTFAQLGGFIGPYAGSLVLVGYGGTTMFLSVGSLALLSVAILYPVGRRLPALSGTR